MDTAVIVLSWIGTVLTSITWLPQCYKVIKTKDTHSISLIMMIITSTACIVWIFFAVFSSQWAILVTNCLVLLAVIMILIFKIYNIAKKGEKI